MWGKAPETPIRIIDSIHPLHHPLPIPLGKGGHVSVEKTAKTNFIFPMKGFFGKFC